MSSQNIQHSNSKYSQYKSRICLGLCCINTELRERKKFPVFNSRTCIRKNFTVEKAKELALQNVRDLPEMMTWNYDHNINCFRLSSDILRNRGKCHEGCLDQYWKRLMPHGNWYAYHKRIGYQYANHSDIENIFHNYEC